MSLLCGDFYRFWFLSLDQQPRAECTDQCQPRADKHDQAKTGYEGFINRSLNFRVYLTAHICGDVDPGQFVSLRLDELLYIRR